MRKKKTDCRILSLSLLDLLKCKYKLTNTDYNILQLLSNNKEMNIQKISSKISLRRTTTQKCLKRLMENELVLRKQRNLGKGGYEYIYFTKSKTELKKDMHNLISSWSDKMEWLVEKW